MYVKTNIMNIISYFLISSIPTMFILVPNTSKKLVPMCFLRKQVLIRLGN